MLPGETIRSGAAPTCEDCGETPELKVCESMAGYYVGTYCKCGPYSRESGYYRTRGECERALASGEVRWRE